ncbi:VWA domain-containing protein [Streptomyces sp. XY332]|uniref:VWA domain-containing protein n=1 Tax=Streptomyces sp. XY332 TaxID=1415561 RepID=UPI0006B237B7|nr:VWA domain-containing protein [Streptomyces sp. XY332]
MPPDPLPRRIRRSRVLLTVSLAAALLISVAAFFILQAIPDVRTAFLIDTSQTKSDEDFVAITNAVGSAAQNSADADSLSLRRFGGTCGDRHNTESIVEPGTGQARKINTSVRTLTPSGQPTLESGLLAAIGEFSGRYPFRGSKSNRIIVVTSHGVDACTADRAALERAVATRAQDSGVRLDFRFVGYKIPQEQQQPLARLATVAKAPAPRFVTTSAELTTALKELTIPASPDAKHVEVHPTEPSQSPTPKTSPTPPPTVSAAPAAALADGTHQVYIKNVDPQAHTLTVDEIEYLVGAEAQAAAKADGIGRAPNDVYIRNADKKTVDLSVASDARIEINRMTTDPAAGDPMWSRKVSLEQLAERFAALGRTHFEPTTRAFDLTMTNGRVGALHEKWRP